MKQALKKVYPKRFDIPALMILAFGILIYSYTRPFMEIDEFFFFSSDYSLVESIKGLWQTQLHGLAVLITIFSIVFPIFKLLAMASIWFLPFTDEKREKLCYWLGILGKWSMLDVFVVAILVVLIKAQAFMDAKPEEGIFIFATAIILSLILSILLENLIKKRKESVQDKVI